MLRPSLISKLNDLCWGIVLLGEVAQEIRDPRRPGQGAGDVAESDIDIRYYTLACGLTMT